MSWGYLGQFWDAITEVAVGGATYTIDWFQSIGNAVAGAIGNLFDYVIRAFSDLIIFIGWSGQLLGDIFGAIISPLTFIFTFFKAFFITLFSAPITPDFILPGQAFFNAIPYFDVFAGVLGACLILTLTFTTIKHLTHI